MKSEKTQRHRAGALKRALSRIPTFAAAAVVLFAACRGGGDGSSDIEEHFKHLTPQGRHIVTIEGIVTFDRAVNDSLVNRVLKDIYLKYIKVEFTGVSRRGEYRGTIDPASHLTVEQVVPRDEIRQEDESFRFKQFCKLYSYYYKLRCDSVRIVNDRGELFAFREVSDHLKAEVAKFDRADELARRNHLQTVMVDLFQFKTVGKAHLHKFVDF